MRSAAADGQGGLMESSKEFAASKGTQIPFGNDNKNGGTDLNERT
jgi:hypothetical protein